MRNIGFVVVEELVEIQRSRMAEDRIVKILKVSICCFREVVVLLQSMREEVDLISVLKRVKRQDFVEIVEISSSWRREMKVVGNVEEGATRVERV
jgi:hypothetical protein